MAFAIHKAGSKSSSRLCIMVYGMFGVGKTRFAASGSLHPDMGKTLIVTCEGGSATADEFPDVDETVDEDGTPLASTADIEEVIWALAHDDEQVRQYKTIVFDSLTAFQQINIGEVASANRSGRKSELKISPQDWGMSTIMVSNVVRTLKNLNRHVIITAGQRDLYASEDQVQQLRMGAARIQPELTPSLANKVMYMVDHVWPIVYEAGDRYLLTSRQEPYFAKTRGTPFAEALGPRVDNPDLAEIYETYLQTQRSKAA